MDSKELIKAGKLSEAREQLVADIKAKPHDIAKRTQLFQVLSFLGEWDKAEKHLEAIALQDGLAAAGVQVYKNIIQAEKERLAVFKLKRQPAFVPKPLPESDEFLDAWRKLQLDNDANSVPVFERMEDKAAALKGTCNGKEFSGFKDTDSVLTLFLEAIEYERYVWIPLTAVREIIISAPQTLFDLLWIQASITTWKGLTLGCYLPVLYPNSFDLDDEKIKMGRLTEWKAMGDAFAKGYGQRVFQIGEVDLPILEIREVVFLPHESMEENTEENIEEDQK